VITLTAFQSLIAQGESETLEFKRSTAERRRAGETLCAFLNGEENQARRLDLYYIALREIGPGAARAAGARR
jgi:hypothetical protein